MGWNAPLADNLALFTLGSNWVLFAILIAASTPLPARLAGNVCQRLSEQVTALVSNSALILVFLLSVAYLVSSTYNPFLYFRF